jgi:peptidoglycan/xylan/chitin deacetylase (PgdA/CDA1 family)
MNGIKILLYHSIGRVDPMDRLGIRIEPEAFYGQVKFLKDSGFNVTTLSEAASYIKDGLPIPQGTVVVTFDDGYKDNIVEAAPVLEEFGFRGTFFVTTEYINGVKTSPKRPWQRWECLSEGDIRELARRGHEIGSHGARHVDLRTLDEASRGEELRRSKERISALIAGDADVFSYPYGYYDAALASMVKRQGYKAACTIEDGINNPGSDPYRLKRITILKDDTDTYYRERLKEGN